MKKCPFCAEEIADEAIKCRHCGSMLVPFPSPNDDIKRSSKKIIASDPPKDPLLMALLSGCCIAGLGQVVLGQLLKGAIIFIVSCLIAAVTGGISILITWPLWAIDAYLIAKKLKEGKSVDEWEFF